MMPYSDFTTSVRASRQGRRPNIQINEDQDYNAAKQTWQQHPSDLFKDYRTSNEPSYDVVEMHIQD